VLQTLIRAGRVLDLFDAGHREWGATTVARELGIAKSQAHELLVSLCEIGLLQRTRQGRYRVGWRIATLNALLWDTAVVRRQVAGAMRNLAGRYGESMQLAVWDGDRAVCVAGREGTRALAIAPAPVGTGLPAHCTGAGKVLLASRPPHEIHHVLGRYDLERLTHRTIATAERLRDELTGVRLRGFAHEHQEHSAETCSVAVPIVRAAGDVLAALSMLVPPHRWPLRKDEYTRALLASASHVSGFVLHPGPTHGNRHPSSETSAGSAHFQLDG